MSKKTAPETITAIRTDRETNGLTLYQLVAKYGLSKSTVFTIIKDCNNSLVKRASPNRKVVTATTAAKRPHLSKTDLGEAARQMICAKLMLNGIKVFHPMTEDTPIDLLIMRPDGSIAKCQCKYIYPASNGKHQMALFSMRKWGINTKAHKHRYTLDEVDFFLGYCLDNDSVYVIPNRDTDGVQGLTFWVLRESVGSCGSGLDTSKYRAAYHFLQ